MTMNIVKQIIWTAALVGALGCGGKKDDKSGGAVAAAPSGGGAAPSAGGPTLLGACDDRASAGMCVEHYAKASDTVDHKATCITLKGSWIASCPTDGVVGKCVSTVGRPNRQDTYYYAPKMTADAASADCQLPDKLVR